MEFKGIRVKIVLIVFLLVLVIGLVGLYVSHQKRVIEPIKQTFMSVEGVTDVKLEENQIGMGLVLTLDQLEKLDVTMNQVLSRANQLSIPVQLVIEDQPSESLINAYHDMHFIIEEAIILGNFQEMATEIEAIANQYQVGHRVSIDRDYVYLQLNDQTNYFYHVINRNDSLSVSRLES